MYGQHTRLRSSLAVHTRLVSQEGYETFHAWKRFHA